LILIRSQLPGLIFAALAAALARSKSGCERQSLESVLSRKAGYPTS
jgi:hypothetical protein